MTSVARTPTSGSGEVARVATVTNDANEPELLRLGASLPIPDLDAKFIEFARSDKMKVVFNNTIVPAELKSLNAPDWKHG